MTYLCILTSALVLISFATDRPKTIKAMKVAFKKFVGLLPAFMVMLILVSATLFFIPDEVILDQLEQRGHLSGLAIAVTFGSVTIMPGFIAFPLCGILLQKGVSYLVLSGFSTTLMMVGIITYPLERVYFGTRVTVIRNIVSLIIALIVALVTGICFGELF